MPFPRSPCPYTCPHTGWLRFDVLLLIRTGAPKKPSAEALEFTVNALDATRGKLDFYLTKVPSDALQEARAEIAAESGDS